MQLPLDLYIPPDALEVILSSLKALSTLHLSDSAKQNLGHLEVNVADIVDQCYAAST